jgi:hypothetical protein
MAPSLNPVGVGERQHRGAGLGGGGRSAAGGRQYHRGNDDEQEERPQGPQRYHGAWYLSALSNSIPLYPGLAPATRL